MRVYGDVAGADTRAGVADRLPVQRQPGPRLPAVQPRRVLRPECWRAARPTPACSSAARRRGRLLAGGARRTCGSIPTVVLDSPDVESPVAPAVRFTTAVYGVHRPGTAYRMDEVPIPLRAVLPPRLSERRRGAGRDSDTNTGDAAAERRSNFVGPRERVKLNVRSMASSIQHPPGSNPVMKSKTKSKPKAVPKAKGAKPRRKPAAAQPRPRSSMTFSVVTWTTAAAVERLKRASRPLCAIKPTWTVSAVISRLRLPKPSAVKRMLSTSKR